MCIQQCIIFVNDTCFLAKNSITDCLFLGQSIRASIGQFFMIIINLSRLATPNLQHHKLVNTPTTLRILLVLIWDPRIARTCQTTKKRLGNQASWVFHQVKGRIMFFSFINKWWNKDNSFHNNPCKVTSLKVTTPKMDSSSSSIVGV